MDAPPLDGDDASSSRWMPIESNPATMQAYAEKLGLPPGYLFSDVLATENWALEIIPKPVIAVFMLFPVKQLSEEYQEEEEARIEREGQADNALYFCKQLSNNACGTLGILHAIANNSTICGGELELAPDSWISRFISQTLHGTPLERADALDLDPEVGASHTYELHNVYIHTVLMAVRLF